MAEKVFLHVGPPKTGTTYLQDTLWGNREVLRAEGVLLPGGRRFAAFHATQAIREVRRLADLPREKREVWPNMINEITAWPGNVVLSHEFLASATREQAERTIDQLRPSVVEIVLTARDYVGQLPAMWQETVKMGSQQSLTEYARTILDDTRPGPWGRRSVDLVDILGRWGSSLPANSVHLVTVPPPGAEPGLLWRRFAETCQLPLDKVVLPAARANESLTAETVLLLQRIAAELPDSLRGDARSRYQWLRGHLAQDLLVGRGGIRMHLDPMVAHEVRSWAEATVDRLANSRVEAVGSLLDLVSTPLPRHSVSAVPTDEMLQVAVSLIAELLDQQRTLEARLQVPQPNDEADPAKSPPTRTSRTSRPLDRLLLSRGRRRTDLDEPF